MTVSKKLFVVACLSLLSIFQVQAAPKLDPLRYMYGTWRCNHYTRWSTGVTPPDHIIASRLHIKKGRICLKTDSWWSKGKILAESSFKPENVKLCKLFDDRDAGGLYGDYHSFVLDKSYLPLMFSECQLGEFDVIRLDTTSDPRTLFLYRETLIVYCIDASVSLFMEKLPHVEKTYKGTESSRSIFSIPEYTSFVMMGYEIEDAATDLVVQMKETLRSKGKHKPKQTLFSTSTAATRGTKTVRMYVTPEATELSIEVNIPAGKGRWRVQLEAY